MARFYDAMRSVVTAHGGRVQKFIGDALVAVFGAPVVREDDALRAVRAAAALGRTLDYGRSPEALASTAGSGRLVCRQCNRRLPQSRSVKAIVQMARRSAPSPCCFAQGQQSRFGVPLAASARGTETLAQRPLRLKAYSLLFPVYGSPGPRCA